MKILRLFFFLGLLSQLGIAQIKRNIDRQTLIWIRYYNILPLTEKWALHSEFDNRSFLNPVHENLFVIRVQGRYRATKLVDLGGGFAFFSTNTQDPHIDADFQFPNTAVSKT
jgi:hypothetical protein